MSLKGYRDVPYPLNSPEWASFKNFAVAYYQEAIEIAKKVMQEAGASPLSPYSTVSADTMFRFVLDKTLSPLVYLWEKWQLMSLDDKLKYATPEYKKELETIKAETQKVKDTVKKEKWANGN